MALIKILLSKRFLPLHAIILGYTMWLAAAYHSTITTTVDLALIFYNEQESRAIQAPETIQAMLATPRYGLKNFHLYEPAIYIDASTLHLGKNNILLYNKDISLPDKANLIKLVPAHITVTLLDKES